jgi:hypothetical protein
MSNNRDRNERKTLAPGDDDYEAYVGPPEQYGYMGASQFRLACTMGLKETDHLLDVGCGSLRAGRFFMSYLEPGSYYGIEPNRWLIDEAVERELGREFIQMTSSTFDDNDQFDASMFGVDFDFIVAQSIFSHTGYDLAVQGLGNLAENLVEDGIALVTFEQGRENSGEKGWVYPGCVTFTNKRILEIIEGAGLFGRSIPWHHPRQEWFVLAHDESELPGVIEQFYLQGAVLRTERFNLELSWEPKAILIKKILDLFRETVPSSTKEKLKDWMNWEELIAPHLPSS